MGHYHIELRTAGQVWETLPVEMANVRDLRIELALCRRTPEGPRGQDMGG